MGSKQGRGTVGRVQGTEGAIPVHLCRGAAGGVHPHRHPLPLRSGSGAVPRPLPRRLHVGGMADFRPEPQVRAARADEACRPRLPPEILSEPQDSVPPIQLQTT